MFALPANASFSTSRPTTSTSTRSSFEELLQNHAGTVFLVSHDRRFLDNVVTSTTRVGGRGASRQWREYEGGYEDWKLQRARSLAARAESAAAAASAPPRRPARATAPSPRPAQARTRSSASSTNCQRDIDALEAEQRALGEQLAGSEICSGSAARLAEAQAAMPGIEEELAAALSRALGGAGERRIGAAHGPARWAPVRTL